ncbi:hypothetical protein [Hydrogenibacillus schlegelii]|uniref:hypothetical protein n=1 Tax=Hydrogenibacillus schlegelii TaxID=1484 RepID=UPI0023569FFA|nr:hypothetical protein [Hydrogenibacillus schlegelii]
MQTSWGPWGDGTADLYEGMPLEVDYYPAGFRSTRMFRVLPPEAPMPMIVSGIVREPDPNYTAQTGVRYWMYAHLPDGDVAHPELLRPVLIFSEPKPHPEYRGEIRWFMIPANSIIKALPPDKRAAIEWYDNRGAELLILSGILDVSFDPNHPYWKGR